MNDGVLCLAFSERNTNVGLQNLYATENFRLILKTNTLEAPGMAQTISIIRDEEDSTDLIRRNQQLLDGTANCRVKTMVLLSRNSCWNVLGFTISLGTDGC
ncbi:hypothetical protein QYF36_022696 [Acer negundo]|nr:hypothetical protein QYF36_022696 [Acer negundo]